MTVLKAVLQYRASPGFRRQLVDFESEWLQITVVDEADKSAFGREMQDANVLLHVLERVTAQAIAGAPQLQLIQKIGVGVNTIDLDAARSRNIAVANMPGTNSQAVAELTLALMFATLRRLRYFDGQTRQGTGWSADLAVFDQIGELQGRTVGLVGYGAVAQRVATVLRALDAQVLYTATGEKPDATASWRSFDALLEESDVLSLHLPLTEKTAELLDQRAFDRMKHGCVLINTSRGGLVAEAALIRALTSGHLAAAALDVFQEEPAGADNPLFQLSNVIVTPHIAWLTPETLARSLDIAIENCRRLRDNEELLHRVV